MDFYSLLGVSPQATQQEIRVAFKRCALLVHPDKNGGSKDAFQRVLLGFETLSDAQSRALYDEKLQTASHKLQSLAPTDTGQKRSRSDEGSTLCKDQVSQKVQSSYLAEAHSKKESLRLKCITRSTMYRAGMPFFDKIYFLLRRLSKDRRRLELARVFARQFQLCLETWIAGRQCVKEDVSHNHDSSGATRNADDCTVHQPDDRQLALCDASLSEELAKGVHYFGVIASPKDGGYMHEHENLTFSRNSIHGICRSQAGDKTWYAAEIHVESLLLRSRYALDLAITLDHLVILTAIKQRILFAFTCDASLAEVVKDAIASMLVEHNTTAEEMGLRYKVQFCWSMGPQLCTPIVRNLDLALDAWSQLRPFRSPLRGGRSSTHEYMQCLHRFGRDWPNLRSTYLAIVERAGLKGSQWIARIDTAEQKSRVSRQRRLEMCECLCMADEERRELQRQAFERRERDHERAERYAMASEDRQSVNQRRQRMEIVEASISQRLGYLSDCWKQRLARLQAKKRKEQQLVQFAQAAKARNLAKRHHREREAHWKWMNRRDITTADLLQKQTIAKQASFPEWCKRRKQVSEQSHVSFAVVCGG